jgi:hypothetical protein
MNPLMIIYYLILYCYTSSILLLLLLLVPSNHVAAAFSTGRSSNNNNNNNNNDPQPPSFTLNDRFKAICPADINAIRQFDPSLLVEQEKEILTAQDIDDQKTTTTPTTTASTAIWVAIYRSSNNLPSVLIKDEFRNAMRLATSFPTVLPSSTSSSSTSMNDLFLSSQIETVTSSREKSKRMGNNNNDNNDDATSFKGIKEKTPVAVAKLSPSTEFKNCWTIENMRCSLRKEDINPSCDGKSEHAEAISICIDELILHHLQMKRDFDDGVIRVKATIHQGRLLEDRGFEEVQELSRDMATHVSSLDGSLVKYAERAVETLSKSPGARDRALKILNLLGRQEPKLKKKRGYNKNSGEKGDNGDDDDDDDYDPWANIKRFI